MPESGNTIFRNTLLSRRFWMVFFCLSLIAALYSSKYVLSVSMFGLMATAFIRRDLWRALSGFFSEPAYWFPAVIFLLTLLGGLYSEDTGYWLERLRLRLPFIGLPVAFAMLPYLRKRQYEGVLAFFVLLSTAVTVGVGLLYMQNFEIFTERLGMGQALKTPINHILFSLLLCFAHISAWVLYRSKFYFFHRAEVYLWLLLSGFLAIFLHILSVRSGLMALYTVWLLLGLRHMWRTRSMAVGIAMAVAVCVLPLLAYKFIPSFQTRMNYAIWDLQQFRSGTGNLYSDSDRLTSIRLGLQIGMTAPIWGIGAGDVKGEMTRKYAEQHPNTSKVLIPHNQWVNIFAGSGLLGVLVFGVGFFGALFWRRRYRDTLLVSLHIIVCCSFLWESTIETAIGTAIFMFFLMLTLHRQLAAEASKTIEMSK